MRKNTNIFLGTLIELVQVEDDCRYADFNSSDAVIQRLKRCEKKIHCN
jgi:hypothetical protein